MHGTAAAFPVLAGMNRCLDGGRSSRKRVPRTRGDEPVPPGIHLFAAARSPYSRG